jgi:tellurite resistance protein
VHVHRGTRTDQPPSHQLTHFAQGPLAALLPLAAMLLGAALHRTSPACRNRADVDLPRRRRRVRRVDSELLDARGVAARIRSRRLLPALSARPAWSVHSPRHRRGLTGWPSAASPSASFFWLVISVLFFLRLALRPTMPAPLVPTLAILVAPPAVASAAWLTISGGRPDHVFEGLTAMTAFMVADPGDAVAALPRTAVHARLLVIHLPRGQLSLRSRITWLHLLQPPAWQAITVGVLAARHAPRRGRSRRSRSSSSAPRPARRGGRCKALDGDASGAVEVSRKHVDFLHRTMFMGLAARTDS